MSNLAMLLLAATIGGAPVNGYISAAPTIVQSTAARRLTSTLDYSGFSGHSYPDGPGWTNAKVQRMAKKRRNKARHKAACKGR